MSTMSQLSHLTNSEAWRVVGRPGQGRRRSTTPNEDRYLVLTAQRHRNMNATFLQQHLCSATGTTVLTQTVRNRLHGVGVFSSGGTVAVGIILRSCTKVSDLAVGGVLVYGGISIDGRTDLYIIRDVPLTARRYRDEILRLIVVTYAAAIGDDFIIMDDNCRPHRANLVEDFLFEEAIDALGRRVAGRQPPPQTLQELERALLEEWDRIPQLVINSLIDSMPQRDNSYKFRNMSNMSTEAEYEDRSAKESIEIPNSGGVRKSKYINNGEMIRFIHDDTKTLWDVLQRGIRESGDGRCYGWRNDKSNYNWISYSQFIKRAENFGSGLVKIGLKPGQSSNVGIYSRNRVEHGCCRTLHFQSGCASRPLYDTRYPASYRPDGCVFMIKQAEVEVIICDQEDKARKLLHRKKEIPCLKNIIIMLKNLSEELIRLGRENDVKLHLFTDIEALGEKNPAPQLLPKFSDVCLICYTSGTTGVPKGAVLVHQCLVSSICATRLVLGKDTITKEDTALSYLPLAHIFEQAAQVLILLCGGSIGFLSGDITLLVDDMRVLQPTILASVPRILNKLYDKAQALFGSKMRNDASTENSAIIEKSLNALGFQTPFL
ncbi:long-chain-fatty-acid--CoA ligase 5 [Trichonephila clavipes]|nr:long-chain-fatty-acid--CoA ligase 5 [Trichonephila clavipes]